jgi:hypothetical protein
MIAGLMHSGSGLGNQLFRYITTRTLATDKGLSFGMIASENFKGTTFMELDMGMSLGIPYITGTGGEVVPISSWVSFSEKKVVENGVDIRSYDPEINFVEDNTIIDGEFQDSRYWMHHIEDITKWLKTEPLFMPNDLCVIGFRGGEYKYVQDLFLPKAYWETAIGMMKLLNPKMRFMAVTDDIDAAAQMLPEYVKITHDMATDWRAVRAARYLIIANSSFFILPALINNNVRKVIAPRYWARYTIGGPWATAQNYYQKFHYI